MIRCPFNNFSKCDGSCPFSMPDFTGCRLATALVAIEGATKGTHAQVVTTNAHLTDVRDKLDGITQQPTRPADGTPAWRYSSRTRGPKYTDLSYVTLASSKSKQKGTAYLTLTEKDASTVIDTIGETCSYAINKAEGAIVLMRGTDRKVSRTPVAITRKVSMQTDAQLLMKMFPDATHVYFDAEVVAGMVVLRHNGKVD